MNKIVKKRIEKIQKLIEQLDSTTKQLISFQKTLEMDGVILNPFLNEYLANTRKLVNALHTRIKFIEVYEC